MLSDSVMTSQDFNPLAEEAANFQSTSVVASAISQDFPSAREEIKRTPAQNKMVYSSGIGINIEKKELEIDGESFVFMTESESIYPFNGLPLKQSSGSFLHSLPNRG
jgi:hypothetical protein